VCLNLNENSINSKRWVLGRIQGSLPIHSSRSSEWRYYLQSLEKR
jgi:hypothetical protein